MSEYSNIHNFLQRCSEDIPTANQYEYIGWAEDFDWSYIHKGGVISNTRCNSITVTEDLDKFELEPSDKSEVKCLRFLKENIFGILENSHAKIMFAFMLLSLVTSRFKTVSPEFFMLLYEKSGAFKTSVAKILFNIHKGYYHVAPMNLTITTPAAMERIGQMFRDCVCLYDDASPSTKPEFKAEMELKIERLSRSTGDRTGRTKMNGKREQSMKALGLSAVTAEYVPIENPSSVARTAIIRFDKEKVDRKKLAIARNKRNIYPTAIINYICYICDLGDNYMEDLEKYFHKACKRLSFLEDVHSRTPFNAAWLYASYKMFLKYAENVDGTIFESDELETFENDLIMLMKSQKEYMANQDGVRLYINSIKELLSTKSITLSPITIDEHNRKIANSGSKDIGFVDGLYVYLLPDITFSVVNKFLGKQNKVFPITSVTLNELLKEDGYIVTNGGENPPKTIKITINGIRMRVLRFNKSVFFK